MRTVVQIAAVASASMATVGTDTECTSNETVYALCDDGSVWWYDMIHGKDKWQSLPAIPQDGDK